MTIVGLIILILGNIVAFILMPKVQNQTARLVLTIAVIAFDIIVLLAVFWPYIDRYNTRI